MLKYSSDSNRYLKLRIGLQCLANLFSLTGLCMILGAMFSSGWQVAYYTQSGKGVFEHGLYRDCVKGQDNIKPYEDWVCFWKFDQNNHIETDRFFKLRDYQVSVLVIFGISCVFAIITVVCAASTFCTRICNIPWAVCALITAVLAVVGIGIFGFNASISDNRFIRMYNFEVDMWLGSSFYVAIAGVICHFLALVLACLCIGLAFTEMRRLNGNGRYAANRGITMPKQTITTGPGTTPNYALNVKATVTSNEYGNGATNGGTIPVMSGVPHQISPGRQTGV